MRDAQDRAIAPAPPGRRKVVLATSIAETSLTIEGVRIVIDCGLARVPRYEPDVGLTRLETVRVSRAAADQRRGRAGRTEPGVCYRLWDEPQTALARGVRAAGNPRRRSVRPSCSISRIGASPIRATLAFLDPPPRAALDRSAQRCCASSARIDADGRITDEGRSAAALPLPPRLARMVVDAARDGAGELAAEIAASVTERGLGGDDVDLTHRLDAVPPRPLPPRARTRARMARALGRDRPAADRAPAAMTHSRRRAARARLSRPHRQEPRRRQGASCSPMGAAPIVDPASPLAREPFLAVAEIDRAAPRRPHPAGGADHARRDRGALRRPDRDARRGRRSIRASRALARAAHAPARRHRAAGTADAGRRRRGDRAHAGARRSRRSASTGCPGARRCSNGATACMFLRRPKATNGPTCPTRRSPRAQPTGSRRCSPARPRWRSLAPTILPTALLRLLPWNLRRRLDAEAPTHFEAPSGSQVPIDYEAERGPSICDPRAGTVRPRPPSRRSPAAACRW